MSESLKQNQTSVESVSSELLSTDSATQPEETVSVEEFTISGDDLVGKVKELIHQGNIRRIILKNEEGRILIEIPLTRIMGYKPRPSKDGFLLNCGWD